jgi:hypothetical protein
MHIVLTVLLLTLQAPDTAVKLDGFVQQIATRAGDSALAQLVLAYPLSVAGTRQRLLALPGEARRWARYVDRYVEAEGRIVPPATLEAPRLREVSPPGTGRKDVSPTFTERAEIRLAVVPQRILWQDALGNATGVVVTAYFTMVNHGDVPIDFYFGTQGVLCLSVVAAGGREAAWRDAWRPALPSDRVRVQMGAVVRYLAPLPEAAAPAPGRYTLHASLCSSPNYEVTAEFEVGATP